MKWCEKCLRFAPMPRQPSAELTTIASLWLSSQWEMDILWPFLKAFRRTQLVLLVVEYFTKWVEVEALVEITISKIIFFFFFYGRTLYVDLDFHICLLLTTTPSLLIERWNNTVKGSIFSIGSPPSLILRQMDKLNSLIKYC